jgi:Natural resistance-associated macrophage protein
MGEGQRKIARPRGVVPVIASDGKCNLDTLIYRRYYRVPVVVVLSADRPHLQMADTCAARLCRDSFLGHVDWQAAALAAFLPRISWSREYLALLLGILGTTISPYLFFWQASQEVEEERSEGRNLAQRQGATDGDLHRLRTDTMTGMFAANPHS